eukprot:2681078-Rhodomonas_salina.1
MALSAGTEEGYGGSRALARRAPPPLAYEGVRPSCREVSRRRRRREEERGRGGRDRGGREGEEDGRERRMGGSGGGRKQEEEGGQGRGGIAAGAQI